MKVTKQELARRGRATRDHGRAMGERRESHSWLECEIQAVAMKTKTIAAEISQCRITHGNASKTKHPEDKLQVRRRKRPNHKLKIRKRKRFDFKSVPGQYLASPLQPQPYSRCSCYAVAMQYLALPLQPQQDSPQSCHAVAMQLPWRWLPVAMQLPCSIWPCHCSHSKIRCAVAMQMPCSRHALSLIHI